MSMKTASERGRSNRRKGATFEREIARWLREQLGVTTKRNLKQYQEAQHGDLEPVGPYLIECKAHARLSIKSWWQQAVVAAKAASLEPLLIYKVRGSFRAVLLITQFDRGMAYEYTMDIGPVALAEILREALPWP